MARVTQESLRQEPVATITDQVGLQALSHPMRVAILEALTQPGSAADVARALDQPRQKVNYHLKMLEEAGLVRVVESRQKGNFVEVRYCSVGRSFVVSPEVAWNDDRRLETMRSQHSLETLVNEGARLQHDAAALLDRATFDGEEIASATVDAHVVFASESERAAFMREYLETLRDLIDRHGGAGGSARSDAPDGEAYRVLLAAYPDA